MKRTDFTISVPYIFGTFATSVVLHMVPYFALFCLTPWTLLKLELSPLAFWWYDRFVLLHLFIFEVRMEFGTAFRSVCSCKWRAHFLNISCSRAHMFISLLFQGLHSVSSSAIFTFKICRIPIKKEYASFLGCFISRSDYQNILSAYRYHSSSSVPCCAFAYWFDKTKSFIIFLFMFMYSGWYLAIFLHSTIFIKLDAQSCNWHIWQAE